jgi:hypothetical protein
MPKHGKWKRWLKAMNAGYHEEANMMPSVSTNPDKRLLVG